MNVERIPWSPADILRLVAVFAASSAALVVLMAVILWTLR